MEDLRRELIYRPLVLAALALVVGLSAPLHPANLLFLLPLLIARRPWPVALAFVLGLALAPRPTPLLPSARWIDAEATVLSVPAQGPYGPTADVLAQGRRWRATFPPGLSPVRGEVWQVRGIAKPLGEASEGQRLRGIEGRLDPRDLRKVADAPLPWRVADAWRRGYAAFLGRTLSPDAARWLGAFAFRIDDLDEAERDALTRTGTVHLVAASGLHVAALGLVLMGLGSAFGVRRSATLAATFAALALYAMATGLHLPTVRACLAFAVGSSAYLVRREPDGLSALALAALVYLPFDPAAVYGLGFQLSTVVVGFLVLWPRRDLEAVRTAGAWFRERVWEGAAVSLIAAFAAAPITALHEGSVALLSVPANVVAVPPVLAAMTLSLVSHPLHAGWAMPFVGGLVGFAKASVEIFDRFPFATLALPPFSPYLLVPFYGIWIAFWRPRARRV